MPKNVDHAQRRIEIVEATWRIIARGGFAAATMREIAAEAGFANGGLKPYFATKDELLAAAYDRTFFLVNERAGERLGGATGLDAVLVLCREMLPLDAQRSVEARVTMAFWDRAASNDQLRKLHADSYSIWRHWLENELASASRRNELTATHGIQPAIDELLALVTGLRVQAVMTSGGVMSDDRQEILVRAVDRLRPSGPSASRPRKETPSAESAPSEPEVPVDRAGVGHEFSRRP